MKNPLSIFYPHEYVDNVFCIDYDKLRRSGFKGVVFDIDMTLVPHGFDSTPEIDGLFKIIHAAGLKTLLLTNNSEKRVQNFIRNIDTPYICEARKPEPENFLKAVEMLGLEKSEVVYVGDQIFVDIYGANCCGLANILVKFVCAEVEKNIGIRRRLEKIILKFYARSESYQHRLGDIFKNGGEPVGFLEQE